MWAAPENGWSKLGGVGKACGRPGVPHAFVPTRGLTRSGSRGCHAEARSGSKLEGPIGDRVGMQRGDRWRGSTVVVVVVAKLPKDSQRSPTPVVLHHIPAGSWMRMKTFHHISVPQTEVKVLLCSLNRSPEALSWTSTSRRVAGSGLYAQRRASQIVGKSSRWLGALSNLCTVPTRYWLLWAETLEQRANAPLRERGNPSASNPGRTGDETLKRQSSAESVLVHVEPGTFIKTLLFQWQSPGSASVALHAYGLCVQASIGKKANTLLASLARRSKVAHGFPLRTRERVRPDRYRDTLDVPDKCNGANAVSGLELLHATSIMAVLLLGPPDINEFGGRLQG
ncbi:hypothetical protein BJ546DRAFT_946674 [Cryomyces antarcticus]